jgi:hypothetical protein
MSKRADAIGFFWEDLPPEPKEKKEKIKRTPPERTWEHPDYLPGLYEALSFQVEQFDDYSLYQAKGGQLVLDIECYSNYFLAAFRCVQTRKLVYFELSEATGFKMDYGKLEWVLHNFTIITFNGNWYDVPIATLALAGKSCAELKQATLEIIVNGTQPWMLLRSMKVKQLKIDHVDLIEVAPLTGSLKKYAARLHIQRMQDLPFHPDTLLTIDKAAIVRWYCINSDIPATIRLLEALSEQLTLRTTMSNEYGIDLRSKSDAQIAEAVIETEIKRLQGGRLSPPSIPPGTKYRYHVPSFMRFQTPLLNWALDVVRNTDFVVSEFGNITLPESLTGLKLPIAYGLYRMGNGGLHSSESSITHVADHTFRILDVDVESFYPRIILNQGLYPQHLGFAFLRVYENIVNRRVNAKREAKRCKEAGDKAGEAKWKVAADSLKITINGTFGKLGNMYSVIYAPDLLIQVTLTGQLSLLMLIERLELACIHVVSANTDGIVMRVPTYLQTTYEQIVKQWERDTSYTTEETEYSILMSRDVNNYIAVKKKDSETKNKGAFANPWSIPNNIFQLHKNPQNMICTEAIEQYITRHVPYEKTIRECKDITKFVTVRDVKGGGVKVDGEGRTVLFMGKMVRWYYAVGEEGEIVYAQSGNRVSRSEGAKPLMDLPAEFPQDVNYEWYINEVESMLKALGYT